MPILRDHRGRFSCLGTPRVLPPEPTAGRFAKLLPQTPLNEDVRAFAALLLRDRGLFPTEIPFENKASTNARS